MTDVEAAYRAAVDAMTPAQRIERMLQLNQWAYWNVQRCVIAELGPLPPEELKWQVALRYYGHEPECRQLIEEILFSATALPAAASFVEVPQLEAPTQHLG